MIAEGRAAFYALAPGGWRDYWTLLHPPYTVWHLSYVVMGAAIAPHVDERRLAATMLAFFLAVGLAAHALDELHGRPLATRVGQRPLCGDCVRGPVGFSRAGRAWRGGRVVVVCWRSWLSGPPYS